MTYRWREPFNHRTPEATWETLDDLADAYWAERPDADDGVWGPASGMVHDMIRNGHEDCIALLVTLADKAVGEDAVCFLGAGPIEDLMRHAHHGERFIDELERKAKEHHRLAEAMGCAWFGRDVPAGLRARLVALGAPALLEP